MKGRWSKPGKAQSILNADFKITFRWHRDKKKNHTAQTHNAAFTLSFSWWSGDKAWQICQDEWFLDFDFKRAPFKRVPPDFQASLHKSKLKKEDVLEHSMYVFCHLQFKGSVTPFLSQTSIHVHTLHFNSSRRICSLLQSHLSSN